jgi:hypothetical protein
MAEKIMKQVIIGVVVTVVATLITREIIRLARVR